MPLEGTFTALITPFTAKAENVDWDALKKHVHFQLEGGVEGLVPCGTTGESPTLSHKEHREVIAKVTRWAKEFKKEAIVIAGTGSNSTSEAIELTKSAASDGADYALVVNPYYNKPTQEGLYRHFMSIAEASDIPLVLYNIPGRTGVKIELPVMKRLAAHENIVAVKEATGDLNFMTEVITELPDEFSLLSGDDNLLIPVLSIGGRGVISVVSNLFPAETSNITRLYRGGKTEEALVLFKKLYPVCRAMFLQTNPIPVKYGASLLGLCRNELRLPMTSLEKPYTEILENVLNDFRA